MRITSLCLSLLALMLFAAPVAMAAPAAPDGPLEFKGSKKSTIFNHKTHAAYDCKICHHDVNGKEEFGKCATAGCHDDLKGRKSPALYAVVHSKKELAHQTCMSCHAKIAKEQPDRKKELTGCKGSACHVS